MFCSRLRGRQDSEAKLKYNFISRTIFYLHFTKYQALFKFQGMIQLNAHSMHDSNKRKSSSWRKRLSSTLQRDFLFD